MWPSREYLVYVPRGYSRWKRRPLIVLLHGCRQTPGGDRGRNAHRRARRHATAGWCCCRARPTRPIRGAAGTGSIRAPAAGDGEAAIVAGTDAFGASRLSRASAAHIRRRHVGGRRARRDARHGRAPELFAGIFVHSGLASGAASSPLTALDVMTHGADTPYERIAAAARARNRRQHRAAAARFRAAATRSSPRSTPSSWCGSSWCSTAGSKPRSIRPRRCRRRTSETTTQVGGRAHRDHDRLSRRRTRGRALVRVPELGHAWSGGDATLSYNDRGTAGCDRAARRIHRRADPLSAQFGFWRT